MREGELLADVVDLPVRETPPRARAGAWSEERVDPIDVEREVERAAAMRVDGLNGVLNHLAKRRWQQWGAADVSRAGGMKKRQGSGVTRGTDREIPR